MPSGAEYYDERIDMTGQDWEGCHFDGCVVEAWVRDGVFTKITGCNFQNCEHTGDGWPKILMTIVLVKDGSEVQTGHIEWPSAVDQRWPSAVEQK